MRPNSMPIVQPPAHMEGRRREKCSLEPANECQRFSQLGIARFFGFELRRVNAPAEAAHPHRVLEVKHLVVEQVFDGVAGTRGLVEDTADHDGVVGGVVVAQGALCQVLAPGQLGPAQQAPEEAGVERVEDLIQVVVPALGAEVALAAARMANQFGLARDRGAGREALVAQVLGGLNGPLVELGKQDVGDGVDYGFRRALEQIGETDQDLSFAKADRCVKRSEAAKTNADRRQGRSWPQRPIFLLKDRAEVRGHQVEDSRDEGSGIGIQGPGVRDQGLVSS